MGFLSDTFTATYTTLVGHVPDGGGSWAAHPSYTSANARHRIDTVSGTGFAYLETSTGYQGVLTLCSPATGPASADYDITWNVIYYTNLDHKTVLCFRYDATLDTGYRLHFETFSGAWKLARWNAGTETILATSTSVPSVGPHAVTVSLRSGAITVLMDGSALFSTATITDGTPISSAGKVGFYDEASNSNYVTSGLITDSLTAADPPPPATTYTLTGPATAVDGAASGNLVVTPDGTYTGTITLSDGGAGGTFAPSAVLTFTGGSSPQSVTYTPASAATTTRTITPTNSGSLTNPSALSILCVRVISSAATGNWSSTGTWTPAVVPGDNDVARVLTGHVVTIDQNIGTASNGIRRIDVTGGTLRVSSPAAAYTIRLRSTGSDPIGTGSTASPGYDATMGGILAPGGTLSLVGTSTLPVTVTSGDGTHPVYIRGIAGDLGQSGTSPAALTLSHCEIDHGGANVAGYQGAVTYQPTAALAIDHGKFSDHYNGVYLTGTGGTDVAPSIATSYFTGGRAADTITHDRDLAAGLSVSDCTEDGCAVTGYFFRSLTVTVAGATITGNAAYSPSPTVRRGGISSDAAWSGTILAQDNAVQNAASGTPSQAFWDVRLASGAAASVADNYWSGMSQGVQLNDQPVTVTGNFAEESVFPSSGQGTIAIGYGGSGHVVNHNVAAYRDASNASLNLIYQQAGWTFDHNTLYRPPGLGAAGSGIFFGDNGTTIGLSSQACKGRSNLIAGMVQGIADSNPTNTYTPDVSPAVGVHHNGTFGCTTPYTSSANSGTNGFRTGATAHPNAAYGDVDGTDPALIAPTRDITSWDTSLGGAGTVANVFGQLARRSGFGGAYNSAYAIPALKSYLFAGFAPTASAYHNTAHDGTDIGAVAFHASFVPAWAVRSSNQTLGCGVY